MRPRFFYLTLFLASFLALGLQSVLATTPTAWEPNPTGNTGALKAQIQTAGSYDAHSGNATRVVNDLQIPGALGDYGLDFTRYWNSVHNDYDDDHADWSVDFGMSGWSHSWHWSAIYGEDGPHEVPGTNNTDQKYITSITITFPDGHSTKFKIERCGPGPSVCPVYDPRFGPPYDYTERTDPSHLPYGGPGVNDHICDMDPNGLEFRLCRADGGSVHFLQVDSGYQADEVVDPHGFKTILEYENGHLKYVRQEGGRFLEIKWKWYLDGGWAIEQVKPGGSDDSKAVTYTYTHAGPFFVLGTVTYPRESWETQTSIATYFYGGCFVQAYHEECSAPSIMFPLLKRANDPHYAGPMTVIRYDYRGMACPTPPPRPPGAVAWFNEHVQAQAYAVTAEKSDAGVLVSGFELLCDTGERLEYNGLGGQRKFYYGRAAHTLPSGVIPHGYSLGKVTDFTTSPLSLPHGGETQPCPQGASCHRQNFYFNTLPFQIWDGRNNLTTQFDDPGDDSGEPARIEYPGGGNSTYNRTDATGSAALDESRMHNPYHHWLFSQKDENDKTTTYRRDERRRVTRIEYPGSIVEEYTYNIWNQVETHTLPSGAVRHYEYDADHFLKREWNSVDGPAEDTKYTYDDLGRVATVQNPRARANGKDFSTRMTYNGQHQIVAVEYAGMNNSSDNPPKVQYGYDTYGNCTLIIDELGHRKSYTYDSYRRCTSLTEELNAPEWNGSGNVSSRQWRWYYDREIDGVGMKSASAHTSKEWRVQVEPAFNEAGERRVTTRTFDVNNRMTSETTGWIQPANQPMGQWYASPGNVETHSFTYDENGQKQSYKDPLGRITDYTYDSRNRTKDVIEPKRNDQPNRPTTTTEYDFAGNKTKVIFPDGKTQRWEGHDAFGQPAHFFDEFNKPTDLTYQWGPMKKLDTVRTYRTMDGGAGLEEQKTDFDYDGMGRPRLTTFPDGTTELTAYRFGQVDAFKTRRDQTKRLHYDPRGREDYHTWDSDAAPRIDRVWDQANRLLTVSNLFSVIHYGYDDASQVRWEQNNVTGANGPAQINYLRYPSGEVAHIQYPNGTWIRRNYTPRGQLKDVGWGNSGSTSYVYLPDGKVNYQARLNGVTTSYGYDGRGLISSVLHRNDGVGHDLAKRDYWRDNRDRIVAWEKAFNTTVNPRENGRGDRYQYDDAGQLTQAAYQAENAHDTAGTAERTDAFHYDEMGNRTGANWVASRGLMKYGGRNNKLNQYGSWENNIPWPDPLHWGLVLWYDDAAPEPAHAPWLPPGNGVLMGDGWNVAGFNALNQPVQMTSFFYEGTGNWMWFGYDPLGRCVKRWVGPGDGSVPNGATYLYYDGWNLVQEGLSANSVARTYVHGARVDEIVASAPGGGPWLYHQYDARGHCIMLTNTSGGMQEQYEYDAFGQPYVYDANSNLVARDLGSPAGNRFLFTGREWLKELRVYDYRARLYQPELGRFIQPDPKEFEAGDCNLYRYCHNDPVNKSDPTGLLSFTGNVEKQHLVPVIGSNIKQWVTFERIPISFRTSGNYMDSNAAHHVVDAASPLLGGDKGRTYVTGKVSDGKNASGSRMLTANLNIDYYTKHTRYDSLERQHTFGVDGGGDKTKGILERGGIWDRFQKEWAGGISDFFASWRLQSSLDSQIADAHREQGGTWDAPGGSHRVPW